MLALLLVLLSLTLIRWSILTSVLACMPLLRIVASPYHSQAQLRLPRMANYLLFD